MYPTLAPAVTPTPDVAVSTARKTTVVAVRFISLLDP